MKGGRGVKGQGCKGGERGQGCGGGTERQACKSRIFLA